MSKELSGKVAIVTGGGRGLGLGIARQLARQGAAVVVVGRSARPLEVAVAEISAESGVASFLTGDVSKPGDVDRIVDQTMERHGRIDILVNNAGIAEEAEFLDVEEESWDRVIGINLTAVFLMSQRVGRKMAKNGGGAIVNISSIEGHAADGPFASYVAAKFGVRGITMSGAVELAKHGIRVNSVSPGWVHTKMIEEALRPITLHHMIHDFQRVPMKRLVTVEEVAAAVIFLASPAASGITGTDLVVDCGTLADVHVVYSLPQQEESAE